MVRRGVFLPGLLAVLAMFSTISWGCAQRAPPADEDRTAGEALHDASITMRIQTTYLFNGHPEPFRIDVDTRDGVVTLHGTVPSDIHRDLAVAIAKNVEGVRKVHGESNVADDAGPGPESKA